MSISYIFYDSDESKEKKEEEPDIPDDEVEIPDQLMDSVEKLRQRKDVERNVADEDIEKLLVFCYNGKGYDCLTCGYMLLKDSVRILITFLSEGSFV